MLESTDGMDDTLKEAKEAFELCVEVEADNRADALDDIRFARLEDQWPAEIRKKRELDGRPCLTLSKMASFIRQVVNDGRQNRPSIKVHPADDVADPQTADVFSGLIRNIEYCSDADIAYDTALDCAVTSGLGYFRINTDYCSEDTFDQDVVIQTVENPFQVYGDPYDVRADSAEWNTAFVVDAMKKDVFKRKYKGAEVSDWDTYAALKAPWFDDDTVQVAEWWTREEVFKPIVALSNGEIVEVAVYLANKVLFDGIGITVIGEPRSVRSYAVKQRLMTGCDVLETIDWAGKYIPIVPVYGDMINVEGRRMLRSLIRGAKDAQRNFNYWRTTATEMVALAPKAPFIGPKGSFKTDADKWSTANTENHAFIEFDGAQAPQRQPFAGVPAGAIQEAANAADDIKTIIGLHDASMGVPSNETSGRAILARQREGDVSTFQFVDNLSRSIRHAGRIIIDLVPHVYSGPRIIRTMGPDGVPSNVPVNQPVISTSPSPGSPQAAAGAPKQQWTPAPDPSAMLPPAQAPQGGDPTSQAVARTFDLTAGKYDLVVEAGPSFGSKREEAANQMILLAQADPAILPVIGDLLVKNLDWPGADEIAQRLVQMRQQQQSMPPGGEKAAQIAAESQADIARIQAASAAKQQDQQQDFTLRQQQMAQQHEAALQQAAMAADLAKQKQVGQLELMRQESAERIRLKRDEAQADYELAQRSADQAHQIKLAEALSNTPQTVDGGIVNIGGGIG